MPKIQTVVAQPMNGETPFQLLRSETVTHPKEEAVEFARKHNEMLASPTERGLDEQRLCELVTRLKENVFLACQWATVTYDGKVYRMNGQHSSRAILEASDSLPSTLTFHVDHYKTGTAAGMGVLFRQFDARWSSRSKMDVAGAYKGLIPELRGVDREKVKLGIDGIAWYERQIEGLPVPSGDNVYNKILTPAYHSFLRWLGDIVCRKTPELKKPTIIAAAYGTFISSESGAQEFWSHVAKNDLNDDRDPRAVLSAELVGQLGKGNLTFSTSEFYAKCIKAWNCFRSGDKPGSLKVNTDKGLPSIAA